MNICGIILPLVLLISFGQCAFDFGGYKKFMDGYLRALKVQFNHIPPMLNCLEDDRVSRIKFTICMDKIGKLDYSNLPLLAETLTELYSTLTRGIIYIDSCDLKDRRYDKLFKKLYRMMPTTINKRLMSNFLGNTQQMFKDIEDGVYNYEREKYKEVGLDFGDIMLSVITFATEPPSINLDIYLKILKGFFDGLNIKGEVDSVLNCTKTVPAAIERLVAILYQLNNIDFKKLDELIGLFKQLYREIMGILKSLKECAESVPELKTLIQKILNVELKKIMELLLKNYLIISTNLIKAKEAFTARQFQEFGNILGKIIYQLFLDDRVYVIE